MDTVAQWVAGILGVGGGGKFLFDLITARQTGRKGKTDGAVVLVESASGFAQKVLERLDKVEAEFIAYRKDAEAYRRAQDALFRVHSRWDDELRERLADLGQPVSDPPPLYSDAI